MPRWPAAVALVLIGAIYLIVSSRFTLGPNWLVLAAVVTLLIPLTFTHRMGLHDWTRLLALGVTALVTLFVAASAIFLVVRLIGYQTPAVSLLRDAVLIWTVNILVFALWYWEIDGGGPGRRHPGRHASTDFAFPQQQQDDGLVEGWSPGFIDYLFLAFNTSTAFSPTDTLVFSRRTKVLMMIQSSISLVVVVVLAARAINTLGS